MDKILTLNLNKKYFEEIKTGIKLEEYRVVKKYWEKRLMKEYTEVHIKLGYPPKGDLKRTIKFKWNGYKIKEIIHPHFGNIKTLVYAIDLSERRNNE